MQNTSNEIILKVAQILNIHGKPLKRMIEAEINIGNNKSLGSLAANNILVYPILITPSVALSPVEYRASVFGSVRSILNKLHLVLNNRSFTDEADVEDFTHSFLGGGINESLLENHVLSNEGRHILSNSHKLNHAMATYGLSHDTEDSFENISNVFTDEMKEKFRMKYMINQSTIHNQAYKYAMEDTEKRFIISNDPKDLSAGVKDRDASKKESASIKSFQNSLRDSLKAYNDIDRTVTQLNISEPIFLPFKIKVLNGNSPSEMILGIKFIVKIINPSDIRHEIIQSVKDNLPFTKRLKAFMKNKISFKHYLLGWDPKLTRNAMDKKFDKEAITDKMINAISTTAKEEYKNLDKDSIDRIKSRHVVPVTDNPIYQDMLYRLASVNGVMKGKTKEQKADVFHRISLYMDLNPSLNPSNPNHDLFIQQTGQDISDDEIIIAKTFVDRQNVMRDVFDRFTNLDNYINSIFLMSIKYVAPRSISLFMTSDDKYQLSKDFDTRSCLHLNTPNQFKNFVTITNLYSVGVFDKANDTVIYSTHGMGTTEVDTKHFLKDSDSQNEEKIKKELTKYLR